MYRQKIESILTEAVKLAFPEKDTDIFLPIPLDVSSEKDMGDYSSSIAIKIASAWELDPVFIASSVVNTIDHLPPFCRSIKNSSNGFINITLTKDAVFYAIMSVIRDRFSYLHKIGKDKKALVVLGNTSSLISLNADDSRKIIFGNFLKNILSFAGYKSSCEVEQFDSGETIWLIAASVEQRYREILGDEPAGKKFTFRGQAIVDTARKIIEDYSADWLFADRAGRISIFKDLIPKYISDNISSKCKDIGVNFRKMIRSSSFEGKRGIYEELYKKFSEAGLLYEEEVIPVNYWVCSHGEDIKPTKANSDKTSKKLSWEQFLKYYIFWDSPKNTVENGREFNVITEKHSLVYPIKKQVWLKSTSFGDFSDRLIYLPDNEPSEYFENLAFIVSKLKENIDLLLFIKSQDEAIEFYNKYSKVIKFLGFNDKIFEVVSVERTEIRNFQKNGEQQKGEYIGLGDLKEVVNIDEYYLENLNKSPKSLIIIDLQKMGVKVEEAELAMSRVASLFKTFKSQGYKIESEEILKNVDINEIRLLESEKEFEIIKKLVTYPSIVCDALDSRNSGILFKFASELISSFNDYYNSVNVLSGESKLLYARLAMLSALKIVLTKIFSLFLKNTSHKFQNTKV